MRRWCSLLLKEYIHRSAESAVVRDFVCLCKILKNLFDITEDNAYTLVDLPSIALMRADNMLCICLCPLGCVIPFIKFDKIPCGKVHRVLFLVPAYSNAYAAKLRIGKNPGCVLNFYHNNQKFIVIRAYNYEPMSGGGEPSHPILDCS